MLFVCSHKCDALMVGLKFFYMVQAYGYDYSAYGYPGYYDPADPYAGYYASAYGQHYDPMAGYTAGRSCKCIPILTYVMVILCVQTLFLQP